MTITLNTLTTALNEATADCYVCVSDDTILALRNALVDIAKSNENGNYLVNVDDDTDDTKYYIADLMLTKACNIASDIMQKAKSYSNVTIKESELNYETIAWTAINELNKEEAMYTHTLSDLMEGALDDMRALAQHRVPSDEMDSLKDQAYSAWMYAVAIDFPDMPTGKAQTIFYALVDKIVGKTTDCDYVCQSVEDADLREALRRYMYDNYRDPRVLDIRELDQETRIAVQKAVRLREKRDRVPAMGEVNYNDNGEVENVDRNPEWDALNKEFNDACNSLPENCRCLARNAISNCGDYYLPRNF